LRRACSGEFHADDAASQSRALELALALSLPSAVASRCCPEAIAGGLFQRGAFGPANAMVAGALAAISAGPPGHRWKVLGAVSFAHEDTRTPMYAALCGCHRGGRPALFPHYGHGGVAAIGLSGWLGHPARPSSCGGAAGCASSFGAAARNPIASRLPSWAPSSPPATPG
jgi:peptidoglycan biosynthesis protein MviN/MurJ (putative lipid II flippase)